MSTAQALATGSLRNSPEINALFKHAESRHLTEEELETYCKLAPHYADRAKASREVALREFMVVKATLEEIFAMYPFAMHHEVATPKCHRDVTYVSVYATHSMLMNDLDWFGDKLLI